MAAPRTPQGMVDLGQGPALPLPLIAEGAGTLWGRPHSRGLAIFRLVCGQ